MRSIRVDGSREMDEFNGFLEAMELVDISMVGRKFTWYIKQVVLQEAGWLDLWPTSTHFVLNRDISFHCHLTCAYFD